MVQHINPLYVVMCFPFPQWLSNQIPDDSCYRTPKPDTTEPCNVQDCPKWIAGEWSGVSDVLYSFVISQYNRFRPVFLFYIIPTYSLFFFFLLLLHSLYSIHTFILILVPNCESFISMPGILCVQLTLQAFLLVFSHHFAFYP